MSGSQLSELLVTFATCAHLKRVTSKRFTCLNLQLATFSLQCDGILTWLLHFGFLQMEPLLCNDGLALLFYTPGPLMWKLGELALLYFRTAGKN